MLGFEIRTPDSRLQDQIGLHSLLISIIIHMFIPLKKKKPVSNRLIIQFRIQVER